MSRAVFLWAWVLRQHLCRRIEHPVLLGQALHITVTVVIFASTRLSPVALSQIAVHVVAWEISESYFYLKRCEVKVLG